MEKTENVHSKIKLNCNIAKLDKQINKEGPYVPAGMETGTTETPKKTDTLL